MIKNPAGYTLIELMVTITLTAVLVTIGTSAYFKAQRSQTVKNSTEQILTILSENQKKASSGTKDCIGTYLGQRTTFVALTGNIISLSTCDGGNGTPTTVSINSITFSAPHTVQFGPLAQGVILDGGALENIDYSDGTNNYRIEITSSGSIRYAGKL